MITAPFVRNVTCPLGVAKIDFFDVRHRGFLLEVRKSGGKTFYQRYRDCRGRERQYKIGAAEVLTISQARRRGRYILAEALLGNDAESEAKRPVIPTEGGHPIRSKAASDSD
jgi:hypothetical protein